MNGWLRLTPVLALCLGVRPLGAQMASAPVFHSLKHDPRWSMHVDAGNGARDLDDASFLGVRISHAPNSEAEQGVVRISLMGGRFEPAAGEAGIALAATAGFALRPRRLLQFEPQLGVGWTDTPGSGGHLDVPIGVAAGVVASLPDLWFTALLSRNPQFWIAPRFQMRVTTGTGESGIRGGAAFAGGMELRAQNGLGVQLVWERLAIRDPVRPRWRTEGVFGVSFFFAWI